MLACLASIGGGDVVLAQTKPAATIAVACTGSKTVPAQTLSRLCTGLHRSLAAKYPDARFELTDAVFARMGKVLIFEAFAASASILEARLTLRAPGSDDFDGPRFGFSSSDKAITPDQQLQFINRLVTETDLPF